MSSPTAPKGSAPKGRPTPKRNEAQGRRGGPVAPPPANRKEAAQRAKDEAKAARTRVREGSQLLPRDAGPVRQLVRDVVDARRNAGVLMLPLALLLVLAQVSGQRRVLDIALLVWLVGVLLLFADVISLAVALRTRIRAEHPGEKTLRGHLAYGLLRSTVFRRWRVPAARVAPGRRAAA